MIQRRFCLVQDNDMHWYIIDPADKDAFYKLLMDAEKTEDYDKFNDMFNQFMFNGPHTLSFSDPEFE